MDDELRKRVLYKTLRSYFDRRDLRLTTLSSQGARISYVPDSITVESTQHATLLDNRIQCLVNIVVQLGVAKTGTGAKGERQQN